MVEDIKPIKTSILYGEEKRIDSLKAYKAENQLKRAVNNNTQKIEDFFGFKYHLPTSFKVKRLESDERDEFSLIEIINDKLTSSSSSVCLDTYEIYRERGLLAALEKLHLYSSLNII